MNLSTFNLFRSIDSKEAGLITLSQDQLDRLHEVLLSIADDIIDTCDSNHIKYVVCGGTALGAYREGKFIPWDDDLDIIMSRQDYNNFLPIFKEKYGEKYWIHTPEETRDYGFPNAHIRKKGTKVKTKSDLYNDSEAGANVDIFVAENTYDNAMLRNIHGICCMFFGLMLSCRRFYRDRKELLKIAKYNSQINRVFKTKVLLGKVASLFSIDRWTKWENNIASIYKNNNSKYVAIPSGRKHFFGEIYHREQVCRQRKMLFEGREVCVPFDIVFHLKTLYGDGYMKIPDPEKREKHICWEFHLGDGKD